MIRQTIACPKYYPNNFTELDNQIKKAFLHKEGPGTLPSSRRNNQLPTILVPCDNYKKMGPCIAWAYQEVAESKFPQTYILIGANNHSETKFSTYLFTDWQTPLGPIKTNQELGKALLKHYPKILNEHTAHEHEHSIEIQLPFLQFASRDKLQQLTFIPLSIGTTNITELTELAKHLISFTQNTQIPIIASCPIETTPVIQYIKTLNSEGLLNYLQRKQTHSKPFAPLILIMEMAKLQNQKPVLISLQSAYSITKNKQDTQYYASIKFKTKSKQNQNKIKTNT
tara:strand:- start:477 stop:1325 length:849 start_codon:yes stop_codon:yes gene_type:complete